ncbi:MAG TPA: hypothetical protein VGZ22_07655 [Isosphaeraceae bacterium]|jgi:hypothetical protein|nr:hypothetical protein [Isosphaeraceae bacterium]
MNNTLFFRSRFSIAHIMIATAIVGVLLPILLFFSNHSLRGATVGIVMLAFGAEIFVMTRVDHGRGQVEKTLKEPHDEFLPELPEDHPQPRNRG